MFTFVAKLFQYHYPSCQMKTSIYYLILVLLLFSGVQVYADKPAKTCISFKEKVISGNAKSTYAKMPAKANRNSSHKGIILLEFDESVPDSIQVAMVAAKNAWEAVLTSQIPIFINVVYAPLENDLALITDVYYVKEGPYQGVPSALASQITGAHVGFQDSPDAIINLNSELQWNCSFSNCVTPGYNVFTMGLRSIATALGFGPSVVQESMDKYDYANPFPTCFDNLIIDKDDRRLTSLSTEDKEFADFVTSDNLMVNTYPLYSPKQYEPFRSLVYLKTDNSIMSESIGMGDKMFKIDNCTLEILNSLGWNLPMETSVFKIRCNDIGEDGLGSAYNSHSFYLDAERNSISEINWNFYLKNKGGEYISVSTGNNFDFTIDKISNPHEYFVNLDGDLEGKVECEYMLNGEIFKATPFNISLELKPEILSIDDVVIISNDDYSFNLLFNVRYTGADCINVEVEEEYNTTVRLYTFEEPFIAHVKTGNITSLYYSWVTIEAKNKYGSKSMTLEYKPQYSTDAEGSASNQVVLSGFEDSVELYTVTGNLVFRGCQSELRKFLIDKGVYILKKTSGDRIVTVEKILIK